MKSKSSHAGSAHGQIDERFVRTQPRIYLHHLAQFIDADRCTRAEIVRAAKYPSPTRETRRASVPEIELLTMGWNEDLYSTLALQRWWCVTEPIGDALDHRAVRARLALELFDQLVEHMNGELDKLGAPEEIRQWAPMAMSMSGVTVVDSPLVITRRTRRGHPIEIGAVSLVTSGAFPHSAESMCNAAVLLWTLARTNRGRRTQLSRRHCVVADVVDHRIRDAKLGHKRRLQRAESACAEIAAAWRDA